MSLYRYQSDSLIDEIRVIATPKGGVRAYLHAGNQTTPKQLEQIKAKLSSLGWIGVPDVLDYKPVLEVRGFKKTKNLVQALSENGWVKSEPQITATKDHRTGLGETLRNLTLRFSGLVYLIGDAGYNYKAITEYRANKSLSSRIDVAAAVGYALGSLALLVYGSRDQSDNQIRNATRELKGFLHKESIALPDDAVIHRVTKRRKLGFWGSIDHFLARFPSEAMNTIYIGVGLLLTWGAFIKAKTPLLPNETLALAPGRRMKNRIEVGLGITTAASALGSVIIKEKKRPEGEPRKKGLAGVWEWIEEKPLRLAGYGYMLATVFHGGAYVTAMAKGSEAVKKAERGRLVFIVTNLIAEILMAISSKGHGEGIVSKTGGVDDSVLATAADIVAKQKPEDQPALVQRLAGFLSTPDLLNDKAENIEALLREKLAAMQNHPWRGGQQVASQPSPQRPPSPAVPHTTVSQSQWQQKAAPQVATNTHQPVVAT